MWLEKVKQKLDEGQYTERDIFKKDIALIFDNGRIYNAKDTIFYKFADILQTYVQPLLDKIKETKTDADNRRKWLMQSKPTSE